MAILHQATLTPSELELLSSYAIKVGLTDSPADLLSQVGAYRFDDPAGQVGIEAHIIGVAGHQPLHIPVTYRNAALDGAESALIGTMDHSVLGKRWMYDACHDPVYVRELIRVILTGDTEVEQFVQTDDGPIARPSSASVAGSGAPGTAVPAVEAIRVDRNGSVSSITTNELVASVYHSPVEGESGLTLVGTWPGGSGVLAAIR